MDGGGRARTTLVVACLSEVVMAKAVYFILYESARSWRSSHPLPPPTGAKRVTPGRGSRPNGAAFTLPSAIRP